MFKHIFYIRYYALSWVNSFRYTYIFYKIKKWGDKNKLYFSVKTKKPNENISLNIIKANVGNHNEAHFLSVSIHFKVMNQTYIIQI